MRRIRVGKTRICILGFEQKITDLVSETCKEYLESTGKMWGLKAPKSINIQHLRNTKAQLVLFNLFSIWLTQIIILILAIIAILAPLVHTRKLLCALVLSFSCLLVILVVVAFKFAKLYYVEGLTLRGIFQTSIGILPANFNIEAELQRVVCHELLHAHTKRLNLPRYFWDEGLAQLTPEKLLVTSPIDISKLASLQISLQDRKLEENYDCSYWVVKYLDEVYPDLLRKVISSPRKQTEYDEMLFDGLGLSRSPSKELDKLVFKYYSRGG